MTILANSHLSVVVPATDLSRAKEFYQGKLGLKPAREDEQGVAFESGAGTGIFIYLRPGGQPAEHTVAGWRVSDVEAAVNELVERGVTFEIYDMPGLKTDQHGIARMGDMTAAWFKDSEGNILSVNSM